MQSATARTGSVNQSISTRKNDHPQVSTPLPTLPAIIADICCGMGGLSLAARHLGMRIGVGVDVDSHAERTFSKNFPEAKFIKGSIRSTTVINRCLQVLGELNPSSLPLILVSGPPCQGFSIAGSRNPADPRNQVLMAVARAIGILKPKCALIENVARVLAQPHNKRLEQFKETISHSGYSVQSIVLDAAEFGVAQRRRRAFFLITKSDVDVDQMRTLLEELKCPEINVRTALKGLPKPDIRPDDYDDEKNYGILSNHFAMQHSKAVISKIAGLEPGTGPMSYRRLHPSKPAKTIFSGHRAPPAHYRQPRSITVREAARLQGFPDTFRVYGSFGNQMQQVTNAVPPPLAQAVLQVLARLAGVVSTHPNVT
jgi:DNA (cytosine-5)-methyltransferase 1